MKSVNSIVPTTFLMNVSLDIVIFHEELFPDLVVLYSALDLVIVLMKLSNRLLP
jgi:hypothetical protein